MILFALSAMFFLGYKYSYNKAIKYANEQIEEKIENFKINQGLMNADLDVVLGNIELPDFGGQDEE